MSRPFGERSPELRTPPPGPRSRELARRLRRVESRNVTHLDHPGPIFWEAAQGSNVRDADGNVYIDLTAGFGVAAAGHGAPAVVHAMAHQTPILAHGLGDVHPTELRVRLLERLSALAPGSLEVGVLGGGGAEAVEIALKTAFLHTGRPAIVAFEGGYHGLTYGALAATWRSAFRAPFRPQLPDTVRFAPFPAAGASTSAVERALAVVSGHLTASPSAGAVLVEPIQGRAGIIPPADDFLPGLRRLCDRHGAVLIFDEVYTGLGRTGRWFACQHWDVVPDILAVGKALTGALPLSAAIGTREVMAAWPASEGEALHTSTFMGNPVACAAALAQLETISAQDLVGRAHDIGGWLHQRLMRLAATAGGEVRGRGLLQGLVLPRPGAALDVAARALGRGVLVLAEGPRADVLAFTPPLSIPADLLREAVGIIEASLQS